jgi:hypothetical protein
MQHVGIISQAEFTMSSFLPKTLCTGMILGLAALAQPALADAYLFQTATLDPNAVALDNTIVLQGDGTTAGNGVSGGSLFIGADFAVTSPAQVSVIGAAFADTALTSGSGAIFGAIVEVDPTTGLPTQPVENLASITLGEAVFTPTTDGDTTATLSQAVNLLPGTYGLVFGSGLFGATGVADLLHNNDTVGSPSIFENDFAAFSQDPYDTDVRLFAAPEPASATVLLSAGAMLAGVRRRRA